MQNVRYSKGGEKEKKAWNKSSQKITLFLIDIEHRHNLVKDQVQGGVIGFNGRHRRSYCTKDSYG